MSNIRATAPHLPENTLKFNEFVIVTVRAKITSTDMRLFVIPSDITSYHMTAGACQSSDPVLKFTRNNV